MRTRRAPTCGRAHFSPLTDSGCRGIRCVQLFSVADNAGIKSILIKDKSKYRRKNRRVKFKLDTTFKSVKKLATQQANQIGLSRFLLAKITHPRVIDNWQMVRLLPPYCDLFDANGTSRVWHDRERLLNEAQRPHVRDVRVSLCTGYNRVRGTVRATTVLEELDGQQPC
jgi:hypothetical protein